MEILAKLFDTTARVKTMRLFLFNPDTAYGQDAIIDRTKESQKSIKKEIALLASAGLIRKKKASTFETDKKTGIMKRKKISGWALDKDFIYVNELRNLLLNTELVRNSEIIRRLQKSGKMKLIIVAGLFTQNIDSRLDLFVVGDGIKKGTLEHAVKTLESEIGKELKYVWLSTDEFNYRVSMYDKLVRDVLDFPHVKILNKLPIA